MNVLPPRHRLHVGFLVLVCLITGCKAVPGDRQAEGWDLKRADFYSYQFEVELERHATPVVDVYEYVGRVKVDEAIRFGGDLSYREVCEVRFSSPVGEVFRYTADVMENGEQESVLIEITLPQSQYDPAHCVVVVEQEGKEIVRYRAQVEGGALNEAMRQSPF